MLVAQKGVSTLLRQCRNCHGVGTNCCSTYQLYLASSMFSWRILDLSFHDLRTNRKYLLCIHADSISIGSHRLEVYAEAFRRRSGDSIWFHLVVLCFFIAEMANKIHVTFAILQYRLDTP